jgi:hypothetical protein
MNVHFVAVWIFSSASRSRLSPNAILTNSFSIFFESPTKWGEFFLYRFALFLRRISFEALSLRALLQQAGNPISGKLPVLKASPTKTFTSETPWLFKKANQGPQVGCSLTALRAVVIEPIITTVENMKSSLMGPARSITQGLVLARHFLPVKTILCDIFIEIFRSLKYRVFKNKGD